MSRKNTVFAEDVKTGKLFVKLKAVMDPMCALVDGLPLVFFGKGKPAYLSIERAIEWIREEMKHHSREKYEKMLAALQRAADLHEDYLKCKAPTCPSSSPPTP